MRKEKFAKFIEDEALRDDFLDIFSIIKINSLTANHITKNNPKEIFRNIFNLKNKKLVNNILLYLDKKSFKNHQNALIACSLYLGTNSKEQKAINSFITKTLPELNDKFMVFEKKLNEKQKEKSKKRLNSKFAASLTDFTLDIMFDEFDSKNYQILGDFMKEHKLTSSKVEVLEQVLKDKKRISDFNKLKKLRDISEAKQREFLRRVRIFVKNTYNKIVYGVKQSDGKYRKFTQLEYCLQKFYVYKVTFLDYIKKINYTSLNMNFIEKFFKPIEANPLTKEELFAPKLIINGKEISLAQKELAFKFLRNNKIKPTEGLFRQALRALI